MFIAAAALTLTAAPAYAASGWRICNHTSYIAEVAVGRPGDGDIAVRGWLRLRPGQCRNAAPAPLARTEHYLFARASPAHAGGPRIWGGQALLCVRGEGSFSLKNADGCDEKGYRVQKFHTIKINHTSSWTTRLLESGDYNLGTAQSAGIQRLLHDAEAATTAIDGYIGRSTRKEINTFIKEKGLPARISDRDLIDVLEAEAQRSSERRGMRLCNRTDRRIWAAIAHLVEERWESRGWWDIGSGDCARVLDHALGKGAYYILAEIREAKGVRRLVGASHMFCISHTKFIIPGRRACRERFYETAEFAQAGPAEDAHLKVELFDEDFAKSSSQD